MRISLTSGIMSSSPKTIMSELPRSSTISEKILSLPSFEARLLYLLPSTTC